MGIFRREKRRYNAHFVFYKPIKFSLLTSAAPSSFWVRIAGLSSAQANIRNPNLYAHTRVRTWLFVRLTLRGHRVFLI